MMRLQVPYPLPLPSGERGRVRGKMLEENSEIQPCRNPINFS
jgi:hypothetical protein